MRDTQASITPTQPSDLTPTFEQRSELTPDWSDSIELTLEKPPANFPMHIMIGGVAFLSLFFTWAWFGQIKEVKHAQGRLVPEGEVYKIESLMQGEVTNILIKEGEYVEAGDVLIESDRQLAEKDVERLKQNLLAYQLQHSQLNGIVAQTVSELRAMQAITQSDMQAQQSAIARSRADASTNQEIIEQLQAELQSHQSRIERLRPLVEAGALAEEYLFNAEQESSSTQQSITQHQGEINQLLAEDNQLQAGLSQKHSEGEKRELEIQQKLQELQMEAEQLQARIVETQTMLSKAEAEMKKMALYAPVDGFVSALKINNIGTVIQPGETIVEISPANTPLVLSAKLPSQEAGLVKPEMSVQMKFDAFPYQDYGVVSGQVSSISPDSIEDEKLGTVYHLEIVLEQDHINHRGLEIALNAGQTATAEIVVREQRIINILFDPIRRLREGGFNL